MLVGLLALPAVASAVPSHPFKGIFGSAAQPAFTTPGGMAVDSSGDVYVVDVEKQTLSRFKADGTPDKFSALAGNVIDGHAGEEDEITTGPKEILSSESLIEFGAPSSVEVEVAVAPASAAAGTAGDIYVTDGFNGRIIIFAPSGKYLGQEALGGLECGVAVDPTGNLYISSLFAGAVHKLTPTAPTTFTESAPSPYSVTEPCQLAASEGFLYAGTNNGAVRKVATQGAKEGETEFSFESGENGSGELSIDPATGNLLVVKPQAHTFNEDDVSGTAAVLLSSTALASEGQGVAVAGSTIYATRSGFTEVETFGPIPVPKITSVTPVKGPTAGGTEVEIIGTNLGGATKVEFGGVAGTIKSDTSTKIKAKGPPHEPGTVDVIVTTTAGGASETVPADHFTYVAPLALAVNKTGSGSGTVTCNGGACAASYPLSTKVTLAATADSGSSFAGWSGGGCSGTAGCTVTLEEAVAVTATFTANPTPAPAPSPAPPPAETKCVVPKLAKKTLSQAKSALTKAHCKLGKVTKPKPKKGQKSPPLVVKSSQPGAGKSLAENAKVNLKLGPKPKKGKK